MPVQVFMAFGESRANSYASAVAFNALLSMFPLILGILAVVGVSVRDPATLAKVESLIIQTFPDPTAQKEIEQALHGVQQSAGWLGLIAVGGLLWAASGIFASLEFAFAQIFGIRQRDLVRQKLMGLAMMFALIVALFVTVIANTLAMYLPGSWVTGILIAAAVLSALLVLLYRLVPNLSYRIRDVLPGAVLGGVGIELLSLIFPLYSRISGGFNRYGMGFGFFFLLCAWFYLLSTLILFGAVVNKFRLGRPVKEGLIASPDEQSGEMQKPAVEPKGAQQAAPRARRAPLATRAAGYMLVGLAMLTRRRRGGGHGIET
jgi:membrane protein